MLSDALLVLAGTVFTGLVTLAGHVVGGRSESNKVIVEQYRSLLADQREWMEEGFEQRDKRIDRLERQMRELRLEVRTWKQKFEVAVAHIVELRARGGDLPPIPETIRGDLP